MIVNLTIAPSSGTAPAFSTTGLIFVTAQGKNPAPQIVNLSTQSNAPVAITASASTENLATWLSVTSSSAALISGQSFTETVSINTKALAPGVYSGTVFTGVTSTGAQYPVRVQLIVTPASSTCVPTKLVSVFTNLVSNFELAAGTPVSLASLFFDDCGSPLKTGIVQASFGSGDSPVTLSSLGGGQWTGTWVPHGLAGGPTSLNLASISSSGLVGANSIAGTVDPSPSATLINPGGIVNSASLISGAPVAPGEFISIYGSNLASTTLGSSSLPYQTSLAGTKVYLAGKLLPLQFVSPGQINALIPAGIPINGFQQLFVEQNGVYSLPETLVVAITNPAVFSQDQSGTGAGVMVVVKADGRQYEADQTHPASAGDALVIYCAGLGAVDPPVADGAAASLTQLSNTVNPVTVTIGGRAAKVLFAGLAPGFAGLYQVNAIVPDGNASGTNADVVLTVSGFPSAPVSLAIQ